MHMVNEIVKAIKEIVVNMTENNEYLSKSSYLINDKNFLIFVRNIKDLELNISGYLIKVTVMETDNDDVIFDFSISCDEELDNFKVISVNNKEVEESLLSFIKHIDKYVKHKDFVNDNK